jgi:hypothetical protein
MHYNKKFIKLKNHWPLLQLSKKLNKVTLILVNNEYLKIMDQKKIRYFYTRQINYDELENF